MYLKTLMLSYLLTFSIVLCAGILTSRENEVPKNLELEGFLEDIINASLTKIIASIPDPIRIPFIEDDFENSTNTNNSFMRGKFNISNLRIEGLRETTISALSFNTWSQSLNITLNCSDISTRFKYWADLVLLELVPLYGSGSNAITLENLQLIIQAKASLGQNWSLNISNLTAVLNLGNALFDLNGVLNDAVFSALIDSVLDDTVYDFVNGHQAFITRILSPIVLDVLNHLLHPNSTYYQSTFENRLKKNINFEKTNEHSNNK